MPKKIFVIGDTQGDGKAEYIDWFLEHQYELNDINILKYGEIENTTGIIASNAHVFLCFPFNLWRKIVDGQMKIYGSTEFGQGIKKLYAHIKPIMDRVFPNACLVNNINSIVTARNKRGIKKIAQKNGIKVPKDIPKKINTILDEINSNKSIYIKPNWGSQGKGITYLNQQKWITNFKIKNNEIYNHPTDYNWQEIDITNNYKILNRILQEDVIIEEGIEQPSQVPIKFDIRITSIYHKAIPEYSYFRTRQKDGIVTNATQGGKSILYEEFIRLYGGYISGESILEALNQTEKISKIMKLGNMGADFVFTEQGPILLEINSFPGIRGFTKESKIINQLLNDFSQKKNNSKHALLIFFSINNYQESPKDIF